MTAIGDRFGAKIDGVNLREVVPATIRGELGRAPTVANKTGKSYLAELPDVTVLSNTNIYGLPVQVSVCCPPALTSADHATLRNLATR